MNPAVIGLIWGVGFVVLESIQFVFFGNVFQRMSSFLFGFLVIGITVIAFVSASALRTPEQLRIALANPGLLITINAVATLSWIGFLMAVQLIEPAVAYTIGSGAMPLTAYLAYRFGLPEGETLRNRVEATGMVLVLLSLLFLAGITVLGLSGFVQGGTAKAVAGVTLAFGEGVLFTALLIYCQRLDRRGVGPGTVFGLRFPLYVMVAGGLAAMGFDHKVDLDGWEIATITLLGLLLIVPPLYALQRAVALLPTLTISALTAVGPFVIFVLQIVEGRVDYAPLTLVGLCLYFGGAILAAIGAVQATVRRGGG